MAKEFKIPFKSREQVLRFEKQYFESLNCRWEKLEEEIIKKIIPEVKKQEFFTKEQLKKVYIWKTNGRPIRRFEGNSNRDIESVTAIIFKTTSEHIRLEALKALEGISFPVASSILHLVFGNYPIMDMRALRALSALTPKQTVDDWYTFSRWMKYVSFCRSQIEQFKISMRQFDRALWAYDKCRD